MGVIPVEEFEQHCINHHDSRDAGFEAEYEVCLQIATSKKPFRIIIMDLGLKTLV